MISHLKFSVGGFHDTKETPPVFRIIEKGEDFNLILVYNPVNGSIKLSFSVLENSFFDYIASGLPVVNNYPGWLADMITENQCGIVSEPDNASAFADAIIYLADHPEERKSMGANARKLAVKEFSREELSDRFVNFPESV